MSEKIGLRVYEGKEDKQSEEIKSNLDAEINRILNESHCRVTKILTDHKSELDLIATALLMKKTLYADEIKGIIDDHRSKLNLAALPDLGEEDSNIGHEKKTDNEHTFDILSTNDVLLNTK